MGKSLITIRHSGNFNNTERLFKTNFKKKTMAILQELGQMGVDALAAATPVRTGKTAASWSFRVVNQGDRISLQWDNSNTTKKGDNIVILLIRGHGTRDGHYVRGDDFVTPTIEPIFEEIAQRAWTEVTK